jgi:formate hydrogenlyase subunit 3/multisubunit Na+/H+ antiporter MnhD subunit
MSSLFGYYFYLIYIFKFLFFNVGSQNVNNIYNIDTSCNYIRCRKTNIPVIFSAAKASALSITGVPFISGFATKNLI